MRYDCQVPGAVKPTPVEVEKLASGGYHVTLEGTRHQVDVRELGAGRLSLLIDGQSHDAVVEAFEDNWRVTVGGRTLELAVWNERQAQLRQRPPSEGPSGRQTVLAPMPGKVVKVLVQPQDEVEQGQGLLVMEAMKMENELRSPKKGRVAQVSAKEGDAVERGAILVVVE